MPLYSAPVALWRIRNWNYRRIPLCGNSQKPVRICQQGEALIEHGLGASSRISPGDALPGNDSSATDLPRSMSSLPEHRAGFVSRRYFVCQMCA